MSASESPASVSEVSVTELDAVAKKRQKGLKFYYKNRERILAAQMIQRREDPEFQERQRVKEEALAIKEAHKAEKERLRVERQAEKDLQTAKKEADAIARQAKQHQKKEQQRIRWEIKIKEKALALGLSLPPVKSSDA